VQAVNLAIGLAAIWTALYLFGVVMEWLTQHDLLMPAFLALVATVAANALRYRLQLRMPGIMGL
jgi:hypothetical protein